MERGQIKGIVMGDYTECDAAYISEYGKAPDLVTNAETIAFLEGRKEGYRSAWENRTAAIDGLRKEVEKWRCADIDTNMRMTALNFTLALNDTVIKQLTAENDTLRSQVKMLRTAIHKINQEGFYRDDIQDVIEEALAAKEGS